MVDRTDEETAELIREWLQQNGLSVIAGIVLGVGLLLGYQWWQQHQLNQQSVRAAHVEEINNAVETQQYEQALNLVGDMDNDEGDIAALANLLAAKAAAESNDIAAAIAYLQTASTTSDELLAQTASYRLAELYIAQQDFDNALNHIQSLQGSAYQGQAALLEGYIYQMRNEDQLALDAYRRSQQWLPSAAAETFIQTIEAKILTQSES